MSCTRNLLFNVIYMSLFKWLIYFLMKHEVSRAYLSIWRSLYVFRRSLERAPRIYSSLLSVTLPRLNN
jgi:hypothetical protein